MISKEELEQNDFKSYFDPGNNLFTFDFDRVMFNLKEQTLYDFCEVTGKKIKLCRIQNIDELKQVVFDYFKIDMDSFS